MINLISVKPAVTATLVKNDIEAALRRSAELNARNIRVSVHGSTVELTGKLRSFAESEEAEFAAWAAPAIGSVVNREPECVLEHGFAADGILLLAEHVMAGLIVIGTRKTSH